MHKKSFVILIFVFFLINILHFSLAQLEETGENLEQNIDKLEDAGDNLNPNKWDYLGQEWKTILLNNKVVSGVDFMLKKISFVFVFLFAEPYAFSLSLLFVIILWFFFFFRLNKAFKTYSIFSPWVSLVITTGLTIVIAQIGIYKKISNFFIWLIFLPKSPWFGVLVFIGIILAMVLLNKVGSYLDKLHVKNKEELEKEHEKIEKGIFNKFMESFKGAFKGD